LLGLRQQRGEAQDLEQGKGEKIVSRIGKRKKDSSRGNSGNWLDTSRFVIIVDHPGKECVITITPNIEEGWKGTLPCSPDDTPQPRITSGRLNPEIEKRD
jgi:hypothetical protein